MSQEDITTAVPHLTQSGYTEKDYLDDDKFVDEKFALDGDVRVTAAYEDRYVSDVVPIEEEVVAKQYVTFLRSFPIRNV